MSRKEKKAKHKAKRESFKSKNVILIIIEIIFAIIMLVSAVNIFFWWKENMQNKGILDEISDKITVEETKAESENESIKKYQIDFTGLKQINSDTCGWIKVEGTQIEYPVVKAKDNSYYITKSFNKTTNSAGWVFMDYKNNVDGTDKNIVLYGHNRKDGSMFGTLKDVFNEEWYSNEKNKYITFITENEYCIYEVFSVYRIKSEDYYITTNFKNDTEFEKFINTLNSRSFRNFGTEATASDQILTLSTCSNSDYRVAVHAKKVMVNLDQNV